MTIPCSKQQYSEAVLLVNLKYNFNSPTLIYDLPDNVVAEVHDSIAGCHYENIEDARHRLSTYIIFVEDMVITAIREKLIRHHATKS